MEVSKKYPEIPPNNIFHRRKYTRKVDEIQHPIDKEAVVNFLSKNPIISQEFLNKDMKQILTRDIEQEDSTLSLNIEITTQKKAKGTQNFLGIFT